MLESLRAETEEKLQMPLSARKKRSDLLIKGVRVFKAVVADPI